MRLIDADAYQFPGDLVNEPTIDAVPVVHGRWEFEVTKEFGCEHHNFSVKAKCSECGKERSVWYGAFPHLDDEKAELAVFVIVALQKHPKFCEECGAKMDGGNDG